MKFKSLLLLAAITLISASVCRAQTHPTPGDPKPEDATIAVVRAFKTHDIVMLGEFHGNKQLYEWLRKLVATPEFADHVDDIVMEFGNSLYQKSVDEYVSGKDVPFEKVEKAWRNTVGALGPPSPVTASLYKAVRDANMQRRGKHQMRVLCGDPYIDWDNVKEARDVGPYLSHRDDWYAQVAKDEVLARHHRALLIMGSMHFLRNYQVGPMKATIEPELRQAGAKTWLILAGTNTPTDYDHPDHRLDGWKPPVIVSATGWVGELAARPLTEGGQDDLVINMKDESGNQIKKPSFMEPKLKDGADAFLYLGPRETLTVVNMTRAQLEGTAYGKEIERRLKIEMANATIPLSDVFSEKEEEPQFPPPSPGNATANVPLGATPPPSPGNAIGNVPLGATPGPAANNTLSPSPAPAVVPPKPKRTPPPLPPRPPSQ